MYSITKSFWFLHDILIRNHWWKAIEGITSGSWGGKLELLEKVTWDEMIVQSSSANFGEVQTFTFCKVPRSNIETIPTEQLQVARATPGGVNYPIRRCWASPAWCPLHDRVPGQIVPLLWVVWSVNQSWPAHPNTFWEPDFGCLVHFYCGCNTRSSRTITWESEESQGSRETGRIWVFF